MFYFKKFFLLSLVALLAVVCFGSVAMADEFKDLSDPIILAQGAPPNASCQLKDWACTGGINSNKPCCGNLVCFNGFCKNFTTRNQQCGTPANPPCEPGLRCVNGTCQ